MCVLVIEQLSSTFSTSMIVFCPLRLVLQDGYEHHTCNAYGFFYAFQGLRSSFGISCLFRYLSFPIRCL